MDREVSQRELRNNSGEVLRVVQAGETVIITNNGTPVAEIGPLRRARFVDAHIAVEAFAGSPSIDLEEMRRDLDTVADPGFLPHG